MSYNEQPATNPSESLAASMPSVPGAESAKEIITDALAPRAADITMQEVDAPAALSQPPQAASQQISTGAGASGQATTQASFGQDTRSEPFVEQVIDLPLRGEALTVTKRAVVMEEVRLSKRQITEQQNVTDTVRRERVRVEGADAVTGADDEVQQGR